MTVRRTVGPNVVLVGRPNVGKSTLFNRISGTRRAIVAPMPGTTRDVLAQPAEWEGVGFTLVDTGGMFGASEDPLHELVVTHGRRAIESANLIIFVVDGREGLIPGDSQIAETIRVTGVPVLLAVNKVDDKRARGRSVEFYQFGFEPVIEVAAEHGLGVDDLLDEVIKRLPTRRKDPSAVAAAAAAAAAEDEESDSEPTRDPKADAPQEISVAIVGRPNVGKSSLVNRLLREERVMVSDMPGTTRDAIDTVMRWHRRDFRIIDTAGIRRAGRVGKGGAVEAVSVLVARRAIEHADIAVIVIDATQGATDQDAAIAGEADRLGCGVIVAANKWDLVKGEGPDFVKTFDEALHRQLKFLDYAPVLHISAATGERTPKLLEMIDKVAASRLKRVSTGELNRFVAAVTAVHPPASPGLRQVRILYAAQTSVAPPSFVLFTNVAMKLHFSYERFLINRLREAFGFMGTPLRLHVRKREKKG